MVKRIALNKTDRPARYYRVLGGYSTRARRRGFQEAIPSEDTDDTRRLNVNGWKSTNCLLLLLDSFVRDRESSSVIPITHLPVSIPSRYDLGYCRALDEGMLRSVRGEMLRDGALEKTAENGLAHGFKLTGERDLLCPVPRQL